MRRLLALPLIAVVALLAAGVSNAGREQQTLPCGSYGTLTVTTTKSDPQLLGAPARCRLLGSSASRLASRAPPPT
jgi:hypothetical protein